MIWIRQLILRQNDVGILLFIFDFVIAKNDDVNGIKLKGALKFTTVIPCFGFNKYVKFVVDLTYLLNPKYEAELFYLNLFKVL
jgi:hypothetical protein